MKKLIQEKSYLKNAILYSAVMLGIGILTSLVFISLDSNPISAMKYADGFDAGNIMSDAVMEDKNTMTENQIQSFLDKRNTCKTNPKNPNALTHINKKGTEGYYDYKGTRYKYHLNNGKFICLADQKFDGESAAHIIYRAAQDYTINPQVLLVLLKKESGIISDNWPNYNIQYRSATGYACPDTGPNHSANCNSKYFGFKNQIRNAAKMFHLLMTESPYWTNWYPVGTIDILYNPKSGCGSSKVNIKNLATSALYNYTPYQPNKATLAVPVGTTVTCGAYGNKNFYIYFNNWFGSTTDGTAEKAIKAIDKRYSKVKNTLGKKVGDDIEYGHSGNGYWKRYENGYIIWSSKTGAWESYGSIRDYWSELDYEHEKMGFPVGPVTKTSKGDGTWQAYQNGFIVGNDKVGYWESKGGIRAEWKDLGLQNGKMGYPIGPEVKSSSHSWYQKYEDGIIYYTSENGSSNVSDAIYDKYKSLNYQNGYLGLPESNPISNKKGTFQKFQHGNIYKLKGSNKAWVVKGGIQNRYIKMGSQEGSLGFPKEDEVKFDDGGYRQNFQNGSIYWSKDTSGWPVYGDIGSYWNSMGKKDSKMGYPTGPVYTTSRKDGTWQAYQNGFIVGNDKVGYWESKGGIRAEWKDLGLQNGKMGYPIGPEVKSSSHSWYQKYEDGTIYYTSKDGGSYKLK